MLGGGTFITQNKILPGAYINVVSLPKTSANLSERGVVAIALPLTATNAGEVIEIDNIEFIQDPEAKLGTNVPENSLKVLREIFKHGTKVFIYNTYTAESGTAPTVANICKALEAYEFNILAIYTSTQSDVTSYIEQLKIWRDTYGKKCQGVVYNATKPDYEGIINVTSTVTDSGADAHALVAWVSGAQAACAVNSSCTNMIYDGEYNIKTNLSQNDLESAIENGEFVFHLVYGKVRVLEDINSLTTTTIEKGEDFKSNQTMRVVDQIANDIAKLFNTKYLGSIPNDKSGRVSFWGDVVKHHRLLEEMRAIKDFDSELLTVEEGDTKKSVKVTDAITPVNAMAQLYMTVVVQ